MSSFELYLKNLIKKKGLTQSQVSKYSGISEGTISYWLSGRSLPKPESLRKVAQILDVTYEKLMQAAGYMNNEENNLIEAKTIDVSDLEDEDIRIIDSVIERIRKTKKEDTA